MKRRTIAELPKTGTITRLQARKAAEYVKAASARKNGKKTARFSESSPAVQATLIERYLGHFGSTAQSKTKKSTASGKSGKGLRRAS